MDVNDVLNLIPLLASLPQADTSCIGMYGRSRGGLMTYLALTKTDRIRAAVIGGGMPDAFDTVVRRPEMDAGQFAEVIPNYTQHKEAALHACSPVAPARQRRLAGASDPGPGDGLGPLCESAPIPVGLL